MDKSFLQEIEKFSNLKTALHTKKINAYHRAKNKLVFAYEGGLFTATPDLILFAKLHDTERDLILIDNNDTPVKIIDTVEFISKAETGYYEAMNEYHLFYEELKKQRTVKKLLND